MSIELMVSRSALFLVNIVTNNRAEFNKVKAAAVHYKCLDSTNDNLITVSVRAENMDNAKRAAQIIVDRAEAQK